MLEQAAMLEPHNDTLPRPNPPDTPPAAAHSCATNRYLYASGDQPLAGYTIKRGVGQGGFGEIYYATSDAGKDVALKLVRRNLDVELRGIRQCLNLKHPNLLDLYDIRQDERGDTWVIMEYVADRSLEDVLADRPRGLSPQEALEWIHGIGAGVAYLHDRGIVHRDLKPGNIFCDEGVVKLGDYGLSKFMSCSRRSGQTESIGTVHYMAPEVANGRYGKEIDVYALGVILYELLTGRVPFEGESVAEVLMKHLTAKPDVSILIEPYRSVVAKALEKDPALRFHTVGEMLAALPSPSGEHINTPRVIAGNGKQNSRRLTAGGETAGRCPPAIGTQATVLELVREEPILHAVRNQLRGLKNQFSGIQETWAKLLLLGALVLIAISFWPILLGVTVVLAVLYFPYWLVWTLVRDEPAPAPPSLPHAAAPSRRALSRREKPAAALVIRPPRERMAELLGSLLTAAVVAAAACSAIVMFQIGWGKSVSITRPEQFAWLLLTSILGAWAVLVPSKLWEGTRGDPFARRLVLMLIGMGLGAASYALGDLLMVALPPAAGFPKPPSFRLPPAFFAVDGRPLLFAYVACFATLFAIVRWWFQANPLRRTRLRLWSVIVSVLAAALTAWLWQFPQSWLPMVAGIMSVSIQLSSPCVSRVES